MTQTNAYQPETVVALTQVKEVPPHCQLASAVVIFSSPLDEVSGDSPATTAICDSGSLYSPLPLKDLATPVNEIPSVCGGEPGSQVASAVIFDGQLANLSSVGATFDQDGCADLTDAFYQAGQPLAPTALQLVNVSTTSRFGSLHSGWLLGLMGFFMIVTASWVTMLRGHRTSSTG